MARKRFIGYDKSEIWLVVGESGSGKTTFCQSVISIAQQVGAKVRGLLCPARFEGGQKIGIDVVDLGSGERRILGWRQDLTPNFGLASQTVEVGEWRLDNEALQWGNQIFVSSVPCDMLVVDEMGPLEFVQGKGWQAALEAVDSEAYRLALVTVRLSLCGVARARWHVDREVLLAEPSLAKAAQQEIKAILTESVKK